MKRSKIWMGAAVVLVVCSMLFCLWMDQRAYLDKPLFLRAYGVCEMQKLDPGPPVYRAQIELTWITDWMDDRMPVAVAAEGAPLQFRVLDQGRYFPYSTPNESGERMGQYRVGKMALVVTADQDTDDWEQTPIKQLMVTFSDGSTETMDAGCLYFAAETEGMACLETNMSSASSDGTSRQILTATEDILVTGVEIPFAREWAVDSLELTVNGIPYDEVKDLNIEKGETLEIRTQVSLRETVEDQLESLAFLPVLHYEDGDKNQHRLNICNVNRARFTNGLSFQMLLQYQGERRKGQ